MVRKGGVANFFGGPPAGTQVSLDTNLIHYSDLTLKASFHHTPATVRRAFDLLQSDRFKANSFLTGTASLQKVPQVFAGMMMRPAEGIRSEIKTVIYPHRQVGVSDAAVNSTELVGDTR
jgi:L-iditol 2-dehydrogenase